MRRIVIVACSLVCWLGCGGATSESGESTVGGATGSGSGGVTSAVSGGAPSAGGATTVGGSAGAVAAPALGAASLTVQNSSTATAGYGCGASHLLTWGELDAVVSAPAEWALTDGQNGAKVLCTWNGDVTYEVSGELAAASSSFRFLGSVAATTGTGTATVAVFDRNLALAMSDTNCTLQIINYALATGAFSANLSCSHLTSGDDMYLWCALNGKVAFEGCAR
jgi:hypothetical protein